MVAKRERNILGHDVRKQEMMKRDNKSNGKRAYRYDWLVVPIGRVNVGTVATERVSLYSERRWQRWHGVVVITRR
ncbi:hypothetical protein HYC85_010898 [Camellia sinensis]|uniref:Uncharacterized protein n=1 Tax=Camellia sinensis TaxID=4442 RepID=A0A7J7HLT6_CAMSI|nr:hypothetical protein HYC85_010898 [Camellia sinensis]